MNIEQCRNRIDEIDEQLLKLFEERMNIAGMIAEEKAKRNLDVFNPDREKEIINKIEQTSSPVKAYQIDLYNYIFELSKIHQRGIITKIK